MKEWIKDIAIAVIIAVVILQFIKPTIVQESSMEPTLYSNDYIFLAKHFGEAEHGDIIVFHTDLETANGKEKLLIKRVIALPGDTISISDGVVYLNGEVIDEPYIKDGDTPGTVSETEIPEGYAFVMGDNRHVSLDSRYNEVGLVALDDIVGKAFVRIYPFSSAGRL